VLNALRTSVPKKYHSDVVVGLYNGAIIGSLEDVEQRLADSQRIGRDGLSQVAAALEESALLSTIADVRRRHTQLTITERRPLPTGFLYRHVVETLSRSPEAVESCAVHESGHSVDVIPRSVSKLAVVEALQRNSGLGVLTIGDQGQFRGNDYAFLSRPESLSVERVSTALDRCWNLATPGSRGTAALRRYLEALRPAGSSGYRLDLKLLEES
jgi:hypothetical protein